jgi:hypothetical protein
LTSRAAHELTGAIARIPANPDYAIGLGLLSDYETMDTLPRHIAKIISLCITYCLIFVNSLKRRALYRRFQQNAPSGVDSLVASGQTSSTTLNSTEPSALAQDTSVRWVASSRGFSGTRTSPAQDLKAARIPALRLCR